MFGKYFIVVLAFFTILSCNTSKEKSLTSTDSFASPSIVKIESDSITIAKSVPFRDTLLPNGVFMKYLTFKNYYTIQIGKHNLDTILGFQFDAQTPVNVVPFYEMSSDNLLITTRPCGSGCKVDHVYYFEKDKIIDYGDFYQPISVDLVGSRIAYSGQSNDSVSVTNFQTNVTHKYRRSQVRF